MVRVFKLVNHVCRVSRAPSVAQLRRTAKRTLPVTPAAGDDKQGSAAGSPAAGFRDRWKWKPVDVAFDRTRLGS
ncbi:MAG TPA: hypothetical protein VLU94_01170, partial [Candidatus Nitrosotalea sp.]|nr:hypothetical protein [Candidatus Nitrosotalea sp.]